MVNNFHMSTFVAVYNTLVGENGAYVLMNFINFEANYWILPRIEGAIFGTVTSVSGFDYKNEL